ncbi:MAG: DsbA family protein, partial [Candidatus Saccharimonadales bacterium]
YGDYQCPYCGEAYPVIRQVFSDLQSQIYFQFRNFPLVNDHPNAFAAARAAEAAGLQGKFWQMHDLLYDQNGAYYNGGQPPNSWLGAKDPTPYFDADAAQLGLDANKFKSDYASIKVNDLINADEAAGTKAKVQATPTFILDGKQVSLPYQKGVKAVEKVINDVISSKSR